MSFWAILGETSAEWTVKGPMPVLQVRGRVSPLFPLYIQCRTREDVAAVLQIHQSLMKIYTAHSKINTKSLGRAIHLSLDCSAIMPGVSWYVLLCGRSFRGLLYSTEDFDRQTRNFQYSSWRGARSFGDALVLMALNGEKDLFQEIKDLTLDISHLSLSPHSQSSERNEDKRKASPSSCRETIIQPARSKSQTLKLSPANARYPTHTPMSPSPARAHPHTFSAKPIYKHIRNATGVVGGITDESGVTSIITDELSTLVGTNRAEYLDSHGYGKAEVDQIVSSFVESTSVGDFVSDAQGCGMASTELEWFWYLE